MNENNLPEWALNAMKEAGVSAEGLRYDEVNDCVEFPVPHATCTLVVTANDGVILEDLAYGLTGRSKYAFQLAARLAAALEGKPCERCGELEAEVARLRLDLKSALLSEEGRILDAALTPDADAKGGEGV